jgi:hypothetical protein
MNVLRGRYEVGRLVVVVAPAAWTAGQKIASAKARILLRVNATSRSDHHLGSCSLPIGGVVFL